MKGVLYIDGVDAYEAYGVSITETAYDDLVCMPTLKPIQFNDWHERNGIEPDLSEPVIDAKKVSITFNQVGGYDRYDAFMQTLSDGAFHTFRFESIGLTKDLRLENCGDIKGIRDLSSFSLSFSDDNPMKGYTYETPASAVERLGDYLLDGVDLADYGIRVLAGTMASITKRPDVKENLKVSTPTSNGVKYDGQNVVFKNKVANVRCLMRASSKEEFWKNRNALVHDLTKPGERTLTVTSLGKEIPCYYKGCSVSCFFPDNRKYWYEFTLSLDFFNGVI